LRLWVEENLRRHLRGRLCATFIYDLFLIELASIGHSSSRFIEDFVLKYYIILYIYIYIYIYIIYTYICLYSALRLQRAKPELSHIFIYRAVSYFRLELSRFTSFPVYVLAPSSYPFQNWIMFSDSPHGDALSYSNCSADSSLSADRPISISTVKTLCGVRRIFPMISHRKKFLRRCSLLLASVLIIPWHLISIPRRAQWIFTIERCPARKCIFNWNSTFQDNKRKQCIRMYT